MILIIQGRNRANFAREMDEFHRLRKRVFFERMGWQVPIINSWEVDGYDALDPLYLASVNEMGSIVGGLRLLPTMGFNMLNDTFSELLPEGKRIESPLIWEASRFSVDHEADVQIGHMGRGVATAERGLGMNEIGRLVGLTHIVAVCDALMHRVLKRAGCAGEPIGQPKRIGKTMAYAVFFEIGRETEMALREARGIEGSVLEPNHQQLDMAA